MSIKNQDNSQQVCVVNKTISTTKLIVHSLLTFVKRAKDDRNVQIIVIGDKGVGKNSLCHTFFRQKYDKNEKKLFKQKHRKVKYFNYHPHITLRCWNNKESSLPALCKNRPFFVIVYSLHDRKTIDSVPKWVKVIKKHSPMAMYVIVGTKEKGKKKVVSKKLRKHVQMTSLAVHRLKVKLNSVSSINVVFFFFIKFSACSNTQKFFLEKIERRKAIEEKQQLDPEIKALLEDLKMQEYGKNFIKEKVIFRDLFCLLDDEISDLIPDKYPAKRFRNKIAELKAEKEKAKKKPNEHISETLVQTGEFEKRLISQIRIDESKTDWLLDSKDVTLGKSISSGSFGVVRKGVFKRGLLKVDVAIKEVILKDDGYTDLVQHEIEILAELEHEGIVKFYGAWFHNRTAYIVLELCTGGDLDKFKKSLKNIKQKLSVMMQIAKGMEYIHGKDIIHRDLKPGNILINSEGRMKITDYGTSKHSGSVKNTFVGTVEYLAPETIEEKVITNKEDLKKVDIYAYGVIFWSVMTGLQPYKELSGTNEFSRLIKIHKNNLRPSMELIKNKEIKKLIEDCWQIDWKKRPTFTKVIQNLKDIYKNLKK